MRKIVALLILLIMTFQTAFNGVHALGDDITVLYVAKDGSDYNSGDITKPFATVQKARDTIRDLKKKNALGKNGAVCYVREGLYSMTESIIFQEEDSGTKDAPIVYRSYPNETVSFVGGLSIPPEDFKQVEEERVLKLLNSSNVKEKLRYVSLHDYGVKDIPTPYLQGSYSYTDIEEYLKPFGYVQGAQSPELFVDGNVMKVARYPNDTTMTVSSVVQPGSHVRRWRDDIKGDNLWIPPEKRVVMPMIFKTADKRYLNWVTAKHAIVWGRWLYDWADASLPVESVNAETGDISTKTTGFYPVEIGRPFYIYNLIEEIDVPGEYYIDKDDGNLYLFPPNNLDSIKDIKISIVDQPLFQLKNASNIHIKNFNISHARSNAALIEGGENNLISGCKVSYTASNAFTIKKSFNSGIADCEMYDVDGGINIDSGDKTTLTPGNCFVENCNIYRFSRLTHSYRPAVYLEGCGNFAKYNDMHDVPHTAVMFSGVNQTISFNNIYNVCKQTDDAGAIYAGRSLISRGHRIEHNYIHDVFPDTDSTTPVVAVYLDDFLSGITIAGNVIANVPVGIQFSGYDNIIVNNIFVNNYTAPITNAFNASLGANSFHDYLRNELINNTYIKSDVWKEAFPALYALDPDNLVDSTGNVIRNNLFWKSKSNTLAKHVENGDVKDNLTASNDVGFYDLKNENYQLKQDSRLYTAIPDFKPIPFTRMGRYAARAQIRIKNALAVAVNSSVASVNGEMKKIDPLNPQVTPILLDSTTYVPMRFIAEALGSSVDYDDKSGDIIIETDGGKLLLNAGSEKANKGDALIQLAGAPVIMDGRTFLPLRSIAELLNKQVFWDECGLIVISDEENLLNSKNDANLIRFIRANINEY